MELDTEACYQALAAHDARFDGVFFVGVASTGIYCRPVCPAKTPRRERCAFYRSAAAAERAGYRPCRRCRPELAPGSAPVDAVGRLAAAALGRIEAGALGELSLEELAAELGVTGRHLRRAVEREFGVSPVELAQTGRLLFAKRLLTDTNLPVTEVAFASGFSSLRRFNALFRERYRLNPTQLRRERAGPATPPEILAFEVAYRPPLDWPALLAFLGGRGFDGVEAMDGDRYARTVALGAHRGWLAVAPLPGRDALRVEVAASLAPVLLPLTARVKRLFDLAARPEAIAAQLGPLAAARPGLRVPGAFDGFEIGIRAILGQQVSVRAATTLAGRLAAALGEPVTTPFSQLTRRFPAPEQVAAAELDALRALGIPAARAHSLRSLALAVADGGLRLEPGGDVDATMARLRLLPGVGEWTTQYIAMRALAWPDAFPHTDLGIRQALAETAPGRILARAEAWRPWRAYAAMHLWKTVERNR